MREWLKVKNSKYCASIPKFKNLNYFKTAFPIKVKSQFAPEDCNKCLYFSVTKIRDLKLD